MMCYSIKPRDQIFIKGYVCIYGLKTWPKILVKM